MQKTNKHREYNRGKRLSNIGMKTEVKDKLTQKIQQIKSKRQINIENTTEVKDKLIQKI